jgi:hypothetical protein
VVGKEQGTIAPSSRATRGYKEDAPWARVKQINTRARALSARLWRWAPNGRRTRGGLALRSALVVTASDRLHRPAPARHAPAPATPTTSLGDLRAPYVPPSSAPYARIPCVLGRCGSA